MEKPYQAWTQAELDAAYDVVGACPAYAALGQERSQRGTWVAAIGPRYQVEPYGPGTRQKVELILPATAGAGPTPLLAYIHGGYWQGGSTVGYRYLAQGFSQAGAAVALIEYTIAPEAPIGQMVDDVHQALDWLGRHAERHGVHGNAICLTGHSAGGHLASLAMRHPSVASGIAISGIYDLEPIRRGALNDKLALTAGDVERYSPERHLAATGKPLLVAVGGAELPEFRRQSRAYATALEAVEPATRYVELDRRDHFTVVDELAGAGGALHQAALRMMGLAAP